MIVTDADIRALAARIAAEFKPRQIILFGSRAYGTAREDSDVDLPVVMETGGRRGQKAREILRSVNVRFPLDLIVREPTEMIWRYEGWDPLVRMAVDQGRVIYQSIAA